ncbi:hypothetical protein EJB05_33458, partial [Eragrostis curvula]
MVMMALGTKKARKPYTISRPREKWTAVEHDSFVHALFIFGRDWKTIEQFVGSKTATQIRSHAQKYFLKAHKLGHAPALPPPQPRRAAVMAGAQQSVDWASRSGPAAACWSNHDDSFMMVPKGSGHVPAGDASPSNEVWFADCSLLQEHTSHLPLLPDDVRFAEVYAFVGDVFGSGAPRPMEARLQRMHNMEPVVAETILLVLRNLDDNLLKIFKVPILVLSNETMKSVGSAALKMVEEFRRQFNTIPGLMEGTTKPDYATCVKISTDASIKEMIPPGALVMLTPLIVGILFGVETLSGILAGVLVVYGVQIAISASNTGGAWDNAKKYIEAGASELQEPWAQKVQTRTRLPLSVTPLGIPQGHLRPLAEYPHQAHGGRVLGVCPLLCHPWRHPLQMDLEYRDQTAASSGTSALNKWGLLLATRISLDLKVAPTSWCGKRPYLCNNMQFKEEMSSNGSSLSIKAEPLDEGQKWRKHKAIYRSSTTYDSVLYGTTATISVHEFPNTTTTQDIFASTIVSNFQEGHADIVNSIHAGWAIQPSFNGDSKTHFSVRWTADGYKSTGCTDLKCDGFVPVNNAPITPGDSLDGKK